MDKIYYLPLAGLNHFLNKLADSFQVFVPVKKKNQRFFKSLEAITPSDQVILGEVRAFEPLKAFFSQAREVVAKGFSPEVPSSRTKPYAVVGVKACDLKGFKIQDYVFGIDGCKDPFYLKNREENLIVSADCTCAIDTCYCLALGVNPYPHEDYDINLSETGDGFVVQVGSKKGQDVIDRCAGIFAKELPGDAVAKRDVQRVAVTALVEENLKKFDVPKQESFNGIVERNFESGMWLEESKTCVECGACNTICPTCHCFLLYDQKDQATMERFRAWDSCMIKDFARTAGGGNPRKRLWMRLRNRFEKKFDFFPKVAKVYACTGCGRCISACPAKIDIRKVLKRLVNNV